MHITREDVKKIAVLAKLEFSEEEMENYRGHLEQILNYVQKLNEVDTDQVEATYYVQYIKEAMREDRSMVSLDREDVLKNAPKEDQGFFCVPKVIQQK